MVRNNYIRKLILPDHPDLTVEMDVYAEQNPMEGYAKTEWYLDPDFTQPVQGDIQAKGQTIYAKWLPNPYTIHFDANGGTGSIPSTSTVYDAPVVLPSSGVTRKGCILQGWKGYVDGRYQLYAPGETVRNLTGKQDYQDKITLQAQWEPYQAKLDANGGRFSDGRETVVVSAAGGASPVRLPGGGELHRDGLELLAWASSPQAALSPATPFYLPESEPLLDQGSDLYAQWYDGGSLVIYHSPDGTVRLQSGGTSSLTLYGGDTFLDNGRPVRMWNTQPDGNGTDYLTGCRRTGRGHTPALPPLGPPHPHPADADGRQLPLYGAARGSAGPGDGDLRRPAGGRGPGDLPLVSGLRPPDASARSPHKGRVLPGPGGV